MARRGAIDYRVYLVTDSTPAVLGTGRDVVDVVQSAVADGRSVGVVQLRDKQADARTMLATLKRLHVATAAAGAKAGAGGGRRCVPLLVNDRVDVAAAAMAAGDCEGVHLGQEDVDVATARRLLGPAAIIGVTASTAAEAVQACRDGADYVGLGTVFATPTKTNTKHVVGPAGVRRMLAAMVAAGFAHVPAVCIGGIHAGNARRVVFQSSWLSSAPAAEGAAESRSKSQSQSKRLDGVAVVSAIMAAVDPATAAAELFGQVRLGQEQGPTAFARLSTAPAARLPADLHLTVDTVAHILAQMHKTKPLSHNMTNTVVQNFAANVALAVGASPIMSGNSAEAAELARLPNSALVVNMGTATPDGLAHYTTAIAAYNAAGRPVILDPVGAGATAVRRAAVRTILSSGYIDVIKGNESEIQTVWTVGEAADDSTQPPLPQQRGVDGSNTLDGNARARLVRQLAVRERCVVVMTGAADYVGDASGRYVAVVSHGVPRLAQVTGTGCSLGTVISAAVAAATATAADDNDDDDDDDRATAVFKAAVTALVLFGRAAELADADPAVAGPGSFVPRFLDELSGCRQKAATGDMDWLDELRLGSGIN